MKQRGKRSSAELAIIGAGGVATVRRPEPPADLTEPQSELWRRIVNAYPADRFDAGAQPLLAQLARHVDAARKIAAVIRDIEAREELDLDRWQSALRTQDRESGRIASLATRLRLTPQARYVAHSAAARAHGSSETLGMRR